MNRKRIIFFAKVFSLTSFVVLATSPFSCKITRSGLKIINKNKEIPTLKSVKMEEDNRALLIFSDEVELKNLKLTEDDGKKEIKSLVHSTRKNEKEYEIRLVFSEKLAKGKAYTLFARAKDENENSLSFSLPLKAINENLPEMKITEVHNRKGSGKHNGVAYPKEEFVELAALSEGDLTGVELYSASRKGAIFTFPNIHVKTNDIIIVHLTNNEEKGWKNEEEGDITLSKTKWYSSDNARDLWNKRNDSCLSKAQDVILLEYKEKNAILDAFLYSLPDEEWDSEEKEEAAKRAFEAGKWGSFAAQDAVDSSPISPSKSFVRTKNANNKNSWEITKSRKETPGKF